MIYPCLKFCSAALILNKLAERWAAEGLEMGQEPHKGVSVIASRLPADLNTSNLLLGSHTKV